MEGPRPAPPSGGASDPHMLEPLHVQGELEIGVATMTPPVGHAPVLEVVEVGQDVEVELEADAGAVDLAAGAPLEELPSIEEFAPINELSLVLEADIAPVVEPEVAPAVESELEAEIVQDAPEVHATEEPPDVTIVAAASAHPEPPRHPTEEAAPVASTSDAESLLDDSLPMASPTSPGFTTLELELPPPAPPTQEERLYILARDATHRGELAEARRAYAQLLELAPQHIRARNNLALLLAETGNVEGALAAFQRAIDLDGDNPTLLANRAAVLSLAHRYDAAEADLKKAMRLAPDHVESLVQYAVVRSRRGRWREALEPLRRAVLLDPTHATAWYHLGEAANQTEQLPESVAAFRQAITLAPTMWRAQKGLGNVLDRMGRVEEAALAHRAARAVQAAGRRA